MKKMFVSIKDNFFLVLVLLIVLPLIFIGYLRDAGEVFNAKADIPGGGGSGGGADGTGGDSGGGDS